MGARSWPVVAAVAGAAVLALAALGAALAPDWRRPQLTDGQGVTSPPEAPRPPEPPEGAPPRQEQLAVPVGDVTLPATVISPPGAGPHPAVVLVHGGGTGTRAGYRALAERLARAGVLALVYDKRTAGYGVLRRDYGQLAGDALAMVRTLRGRPDVDASRVGLWGISEGGWVVPIAAARDPGVAFVILAAPPNVTPGEQVSWAVDDGLQRLGAPGGARRLVSRALAVGGTPYVDHDPLPPLRRVRQPVLAVYGTADRAVPSAQSARTLIDALESGGNTSYAIRFLPGADHGMRVDGRFAPGYVATLVDWIHRPAARVGPRVAVLAPATAPRQRYAAVSQPAELAPALLVGLYGLAVAGYLAGPVAALLTRRRVAGAPDQPWLAVRGRVRLAAGAGLAAAVGLNAGIGALIGLAYAGGPALAASLTWAAVRLLALGAVVAASGAGVAVARAAAGGWRPGGAAQASVTGTSVATLVVLFLAGYWGLFAPTW